ncbi:MAG: pyridoxal-phosphate dependent enzyme, partial [Acidimicrobiaceae bacterium]|nr:pyridoxal-phosphate dependent enzyme [Acidimicrobiaceae bacterium]
ECGGLLDLEGPVADPTPRRDAPWSLWRYQAALPTAALPAAAEVTMGEGMTPLVRVGDVLAKLDFVMPTQSFKDRGASVLVAAAAAAGVESVVTDSSGNAGRSVAAYAARAGISAEVFVPATTPEHKAAAIARLGATVIRVPGDRAATADAAVTRVGETGAMYASHVWQPLFVHGTKTLAFEIWEQLAGAGRAQGVPRTVVVPVGNGTLLLGAARGFRELREAGLIERVPRLVGVQAARCAPLLDRPPGGPTVADGIAVAAPPRRAQILRAVRDSGGLLITAAEHAIEPARRDLASRGIDVEPTAAATWAAWQQAGPEAQGGGEVVLVLTGAAKG